VQRLHTAYSFLSSLETTQSTVVVELRPPRAQLDTTSGIEAWIDTYHAVRDLTRNDTFVLLTDNAIGEGEEQNLRHLVANLGNDAPRERVVPFLTAKHTLDYCLAYADRAWENGFRSLIVVGGDSTVGPKRCVAHGWQLRRAIRERQPRLKLGGWANPHKNTTLQIEFLSALDVTAEFYLTQIVSHHDLESVERFLIQAEQYKLRLPGLFGVFYYRSGNKTTLDILSQFLPVPRTGLMQEFSDGKTAEEICAKSICALRNIGVKNLYISNLPPTNAANILNRILTLANKS